MPPIISETLPKRGSLTDRTTAAIYEALAGKRRGPRMWLLFAGPAVAVSIAYMDPGNFATNIQAGARYGYTLLWVVLLANLIAMLFQALSAKLGIVTRRNLAEVCRDTHTPLRECCAGQGWPCSGGRGGLRPSHPAGGSRGGAPLRRE